MSFEIVYQLRRRLENLPQEHNGYHLWYIPSPYDPRDYQYANLIGSTATNDPVAAVDYRPQLPPVFDQLQRGSCVACASTWTLKAYEEIEQGDYPANGLSAAYLYTICKHNDGIPSQEGTMPKTAMQMLQKYGVCSEDVMPYYTLSDLPAPKVPSIPNAAFNEAALYKIKTYVQLCSSYDIDRSQVVTAMRQALISEGPFIMALLVCENFQPDSQYMLPLPEGDIRGGHAVGIVGDLPEKGSFILRNSWGSEWGENGYAYLPYEWINGSNDMGWYVFEAWTATDLTLSKRSDKIIITPGLNSMIADGRRIGLNEKAVLGKDNALLMPLTELAEYLGYKVNWDGCKIILDKKTY